jgi:hypothetical protein
MKRLRDEVKGADASQHHEPGACRKRVSRGRLRDDADTSNSFTPSSPFRHDQAEWAEAYFPPQWGAFAAELEWTNQDIAALAWWLGTRVVAALCREHARAENGEVFDRATRTFRQTVFRITWS